MFMFESPPRIIAVNANVTERKSILRQPWMIFYQIYRFTSEDLTPMFPQRISEVSRFCWKTIGSMHRIETCGKTWSQPLEFDKVMLFLFLKIITWSRIPVLFKSCNLADKSFLLNSTAWSRSAIREERASKSGRLVCARCWMRPKKGVYREKYGKPN